MNGDLAAKLVGELEAFPAEIRDLRVTSPATPEELRAKLEARYPFDEPVSLDRLFDDVRRLIRTSSVHVTHPRYFGLFNPSVRMAGIVGDTLAALYNPQLAAWSHAPAVQELEQLTLRRFAVALGMDPGTTFANFTTGGAEANLSAVLTAIAHALPAVAEAGLAGIRDRPTIYVTDETHDSFVKIARMCGLGTDALRTMPTTSRFTMDSRALSARLKADIRRGDRPLMVVATAGTTSTGSIDPLATVADIAREHGAWFHVDAAWGGAAVLSPRLRPLLVGIEQADSVTWDAHKWLSVPMGAGMFFTRHPDAVRRAFATSTSYMPGSTKGVDDPYATTAQWSRRAIGLKVFLTLAEIGVGGYAELIEHQARMGERLRERLVESGWIVINETALPLACFTHPEIRSGGLDTTGILAALYERGRVWISDVAPGGGPRVLRACITSFRTDEGDLDVLLEELEIARRSSGSASR